MKLLPDWVVILWRVAARGHFATVRLGRVGTGILGIHA